MKIGCVMDPIERVNTVEDTTFAWLLAAQARGHQLFYIKPDSLAADNDRAMCWGAELSVRHPTSDDRSHYQLDEPSFFPLAELDICWMRKDPPFDQNYLYATYVLELANDAGQCWVLNHPRGLRDANEKAYILHFPTITPKTAVTRRADRVKAFMAEAGGNCIVKPLDGHGGSEIFHLRHDDLNTNSILESITRLNTRWVMAQEYIPDARIGDKRIITIDGDPIGAILRVPAEGELRGNIHVGGKVVKSELTDRDREICATIKERCQRDGLYFCGVDVIGSYMTEINVTSPTGIQEMSRLDGVDFSDQWIAWQETNRP